ncbi:MAG TPA: hypothetical protein VG028_12580 [Terriglobia bacterium]|nr:hypothetical protein [Terriglobia bacterium]
MSRLLHLQETFPKALEQGFVPAGQDALALSHGQQYAWRELRVLFGVTSDEEEKAQIKILEKAFRGNVTEAVKRELNKIRSNEMTGPPLLKALGELYLHHLMLDWMDRRALHLEDEAIPKIVCSEGLM